MQRTKNGRHHHHLHRHHLGNINLGLLLPRSGLTNPEFSLMVSHGDLSHFRVVFWELAVRPLLVRYANC